jgi:hypothetical protein
LIAAAISPAAIPFAGRRRDHRMRRFAIPLGKGNMNRLVLRRLMVVILASAGLAACGGDSENPDEGRFAMGVTLAGLPDSNTVRGHYEGWAVVNGVAQSTGKFVVDGTGPGARIFNAERSLLLGTAADAEFGPSITLLGDRFPFVEDAEYFFVTLEPEGDHDRLPSCQVLAAGALVNGAATLNPAGTAVIPSTPCAIDEGGGNFRLGLVGVAAASGVFRMLSPTDDVSNPVPNDFAGVAFVDLPNPGIPMPGLNLPALPAGWTYEGFAVVDGVARSTGKFRDPAGFDEDAFTARQRGADGPGLAFPGQDFVASFNPALPFDPPLVQVARGEDFTAGDFRAFITVEPDPDNDERPFPLEILSQVVPPGAVSASGFGILDVAMAPQLASLPAASALPAAGSLTLSGITLPPLGAGAADRLGHYHLWVVIGAIPQSVDRFVIDGAGIFSLGSQMVIGTLQQTVFTDASNGAAFFPPVEQATEVFVTLEPQGDADSSPSPNVILDGLVTAGAATLTVAGQTAAAGRGLASFAGAAGTFQVDTASDDVSNPLPNDAFGILYRTITGSDLNARSLTLPVLPAGWKYEGWVQERLTGFTFSTGKFRDPAAPDESDMVSRSRGPDLKPGFPGEDFVQAVPAAPLVAAQNGSITEVFVTLETVPDNSAAPSSIVILRAAVPLGAVAGGVSTGPIPLINVAAQSTPYVLQINIKNE